MAYTIWKLFVKGYNRVQDEIQRNPVIFVTPCKPTNRKATEEAWNENKIIEENTNNNCNTLIQNSACENDNIKNNNAQSRNYCDIESGFENNKIEVRRSKSRVRSYLKKCKERLTGYQCNDEPSSSSSSILATSSSLSMPECSTTITSNHELSNIRSSTSWYLENSIPPDIKGCSDGCGGGSGISSCSRSSGAERKHNDNNDAGKKEINEVNCESISSIINEETNYNVIHMNNENAIQHESTKHLLNEISLPLDPSIEQLVDTYLGHLYPFYHENSKLILVRQARDVLVCNYRGCLKTFEEKFLSQSAEIIRKLKENHICGENVAWCKGWPLTTPTGDVILHIGTIDESFVRPQDIYICIKAGENVSPCLYAVWRMPPSFKIHYQQINCEKQVLSPLSLEMLIDELPQLLQNLLVGVERVFERIQLNELSFQISDTFKNTTNHNKNTTVENYCNKNSSNFSDDNNGNGNTMSSSSCGSNSNHQSQNIIINNHSEKINFNSSQKCTLKRSELITKSKIMNNKYIMRRTTMSSSSSSSSSSNNNNNNNKCDTVNSNDSSNKNANNSYSSNGISTSKSNKTSNSNNNTSSNNNSSGSNNSSSSESASMDIKSVPTHPLFCLGGSFPHIDSDEENSEERKSSSEFDNQQLPQELVAPRSILEVPEKLLSSGIHLPGTRDLDGRLLITIDASNVIKAGLNCYEIATALLYYSTISERSATYTILLIIENNNQLCILDLVNNSIKLLIGHFECSEILVTSSQKEVLDKKKSSISQLPSTIDEKIKYIDFDKLQKKIHPFNVPEECGGLHYHNQNIWKQFFMIVDQFQNQCLKIGHRLVNIMQDIKQNDEITRLSTCGGYIQLKRQLYSQHRALSRELMDSELHMLRKTGSTTIIKLQELSKNLNKSTTTTTGTGTTKIKLNNYNLQNNTKFFNKHQDNTNINSIQQQNITKNDIHHENYNNNDDNNNIINIRLKKVIILYNEVDKAAKRLEQLTEQLREKLREMTRQRALEDEINEVTSWLKSDGEETLQKFSNVSLECENLIKDHEQEFEKYYFISMKHLAKGRDLHDAAIDLDALKDNATSLKDSLENFSERLENARERIEGAVRLHHLLGLHLNENDIGQEMQKLAERIGVPGLIDKCQQLLFSKNLSNDHRSITQTNNNTTPDEYQSPNNDEMCHCWRNESTQDYNNSNSNSNSCCNKIIINQHDEDEEEHSKIADSGLGGCDRCEGNIKLTRVCSCQSFDETGNIYNKSHNSDELEEDCFESNNSKHLLDAQSPIEANSHLQCHASNLDLQGGELNCLDPKIRKTLLLIMREMIGTERDYVRSLYYVIENYVDELLRDDIPQPLRGQRNVIFGNIEKIFEFHQPHFLAELERYENNPLKVGAAFLQNESKFYLYALYNKNKPKSDTLMSEYGTTFFKSKQLELNDKMDLASYLLKPVQRMGKYALLLQQLVKACSNVQEPAFQEIANDVDELQRAEEMVKFQLRHGNDLLAMDSLQNCDVNVKEQGRLLRQNEFLVWQGRGGKKSLRQVFLFEELVLFSKARRFPDHKNLDLYIYKHSIKTSDIGLTAHVGDSPTKFEIWFRKRKPDDTWTLQSMSEDIKNAWTEEISKLLWKQAKRNREIRLAEMSSMGIGSKPCLDIRPSHNQINDRSITISQLGKTPKFRNSFVGTLTETKSTRRPNSLISESSVSSGTSSSGTGSSSSSSNNCRNTSGLELINETTTLGGVPGSNKRHQRSTTLISQLSMESGIMSDISMTPDGETQELVWPNNNQRKPCNPINCPIDTTKKQPTNSELNLAEQDPYITTDSVTVHL